MAANQLALIQSAMNFLGEPRPTTLTETSATRKLVADYDEARKEFLRSYEWPFAMNRAELSAVAVASPWDVEFSYAFEKPADWLRTSEMSVDGDFTRNPMVDWRDEQNTIFSNDGDAAFMLYVQDVSDTTRFTADFDSAFALHLAVRSCQSVSQSRVLTQQLSDAMRGREAQARFSAARDQRPKARPSGSFRRSRHRYGSFNDERQL